jgi:hypothetical protein
MDEAEIKQIAARLARERDELLGDALDVVLRAHDIEPGREVDKQALDRALRVWGAIEGEMEVRSRFTQAIAGLKALLEAPSRQDEDDKEVRSP